MNHCQNSKSHSEPTKNCNKMLFLLYFFLIAIEFVSGQKLLTRCEVDLREDAARWIKICKSRKTMRFSNKISKRSSVKKFREELR